MLTRRFMMGAAAAVALAAGALPAAAQDVVLRYSMWVPATHPINAKVLMPWAEDLKAATDGRVTVEFMPALGPPPTHFDLVETGVADLAFGVHSYTPQRFVLTELGELPLTADSAMVNSLAYWNTFQKYFLPADEHAGVRLLGLWTNPPYQLAMKGDFLTSLDAVQGKRIRVPGTIVEQVATTMGMVPISSSLTEAYEQVSRGVIAGMFQSYETIWSFKLGEHLTHVSAIPGGFAHSSQFLMINEDAYMRMSEADRAVFDSLTGEALVRRFAEMWDAAEKEGYDNLIAAGMQVYTLPDELVQEVAESLAFIREDWVKRATERGVDGAAALAFYDSELARLSAELGVK
jgi:TRAP-type C4-dicarboxylate transport system substrate-binding protein